MRSTAVEITEVRIKLIQEAGERLQAFCSITFDNCFVIRDLKIIEGSNGPFVAMPSRKLTAHCPQCGTKNHLRAAHCNQCGSRLKDDRAIKDEDGRIKLYADIAHPINSACREMIQQRVVREFQEEQERAKQPGYVSRYEDLDHEDWVPPPHMLAKTGRRENPAEQESSEAAPTSFARPSSDGTSQIQRPESQPRPPHKIPAPTGPARSGGSSTATTGGHSSSSPRPSNPPPNPDEFGAGIF
jgi:stage V sporulation protein G